MSTSPISNTRTLDTESEKLLTEVQVELLQYKNYENSYLDCFEKLDQFMMRLGLYNYYKDLFDIHDCSLYFEQAVITILETKMSIENIAPMEPFGSWKIQITERIKERKKSASSYSSRRKHEDSGIPFDILILKSDKAIQYLPDSMIYFDASQGKFEPCNSVRVFTDYMAEKYFINLNFISPKQFGSNEKSIAEILSDL